MNITEGEQPNLPVQRNIFGCFSEPIIQDFLPRLPVKSLLRFRSVCRSWKGIISDLQFIKNHLERALQNDRGQRLIFILHNRLFLESERNREIDDDDVNDGEIVAVQLGLPYVEALWATYVGQRIFGSCNGLVCLLVNDKIHLFNPSTRESKMIPGPYGESYRTPSAACCTSSRQLEAYGFGYDSRTDDYKVVVIWYSLPVSIYSLRKKYWQSVGIFPYRFILEYSGTGTFLNGALHWVVCGLPNQNYYRFIAAFNLTTERFCHMHTPDMNDSGEHYMLSVIRGRLCLLHSSYKSQRHDFWQMNVYGDSMSWTRFTIPLSYMRLQPLRSGEDAEKVLVQLDRRLIMYDRGNNTYREVKVHGIPTDFDFKALTYLETLVSPYKY